MPIYYDIDNNAKDDFVYDENALRQSLRSLFSTSPPQRFFRPWYGCDLESYLFELSDDALIVYIQNQLLSCLSNDPRLRVKNISVVPYRDEHAIEITLEVETELGNQVVTEKVVV